MTFLKKEYKLSLMKKLKLNTAKIAIELDRIGKKQKWLANKMNVSPQRVSYMLRSGSIKAAEKIGHALGIEPKDLII